ncbi:MAG: hypothetical protein ISN29_07140 [Gammaproteobacteria bacterium AqS3]|nr:hypothetical protein [Gammaproteobacteria bacterium AqS3]
MGVYVRLYTEDELTRVVMEKILQQMDRGYSVFGFSYWYKHTVQKRVADLNHSAKGDVLYLVVTDQDTPGNCPAGAVENLGAPLAPNLLYRFAVMEIEAWIMADRENFAEFLSVDIHSVPQLPDEVPKPREEIVAIAKKFRVKDIRTQLSPNPSNPASRVGLNYNKVLSGFVREQWNVHSAQKHSPSLKRTCQRLQTFRLKRV